jgi:hypothetical protein
MDYSRIFDEYSGSVQNDTGYIILGPPATGKTTFVEGQGVKKWIDADDLIGDCGVNWHLHENDQKWFKETYMTIDAILENARNAKLCVIGALFWGIVPDAIVIPPLDVHLRYMSTRVDLDAESVMNIRGILENVASENKIPTFESCREAVDFLS